MYIKISRFRFDLLLRDSKSKLQDSKSKLLNSKNASAGTEVWPVTESLTPARAALHTVGHAPSSSACVPRVSTSPAQHGLSSLCSLVFLTTRYSHDIVCQLTRDFSLRSKRGSESGWELIFFVVSQVQNLNLPKHQKWGNLSKICELDRF